MAPEIIILMLLVGILCIALSVGIFLILNRVLNKNSHNEIACKEIGDLVKMKIEINNRIKNKFKHLSRKDKKLISDYWGDHVLCKN